MRIITRAEWGAVHGRGHTTTGAKTDFIVHHDGHDRSTEDMSIEQEAKIMRMFEKFHAGELTKANPRIAYSFVIFQSGRVYEGCGWGRIGAHTGGMNSRAYAACFPINGAVTAPTPKALGALDSLRREGVRLGQLTVNHRISGHQDHGKPTCPGKKLYDAAVRENGVPTVPISNAQVIASRPSLRKGKGGANAPAAEREAVRFLQQYLIQHGYLRATLASGSSAATGSFGPLTDAALRAMQRAEGLLPDGIAGPRTWAVVLPLGSP